jgi:hypothetical protein
MAREMDELIDDIEMGRGFRPIAALAALRDRGARLTGAFMFDECARTRNLAVRMEIEERQAFNSAERKKIEEK